MRLLGICLLLVLGAGCQSGPTQLTETQQAAQMRAQVLALHDSTMPYMDALTQERQRLDSLLNKLDSTTAPNQRRQKRLRR